MLKKLTLKQISLLITGIIAGGGMMVLVILYSIGSLSISFTILVLLILLQFLASYIIVKRLLETFIFKKISLIYKFIYDSKLGPNEDIKQSPEFNTTSLEDVNSLVINWGKKKEKEIKTLKTLEDYRKNYVGNISHELKTPIFSILGYLHTLIEGGLYDEKVNLKYLNRAAKNAERLQAIVDDLETISRLESGKLTLNKIKFNITTIIEEVLSDLFGLAEERNISMLFLDDYDKEYLVDADEESIRQVLNNLIINSIKYGKKGGQTKIEIHDLEENILVEISDSGIGIEKEHLAHVFDRFYRIDSSRSRQQGGSGLGLSIVKHIVEAHNQTINLRSSKGIGSTFGFTLKKAK